MFKSYWQRVIRLRTNPLVTGSFLMMGSGLIVNFLNYIYNVFIVRLLGPADYGVFASLVSLLTIISVPAAALTTTIAKFASNYKGEGHFGKIAKLLQTLLLSLGLAALLVSLSFTVFSKSIAAYLRLTDVAPVVLVGFSFLVVLPQTSALGTLQGLQSFFFLSLNSVFSAAVKMVAGLGLVLGGFAVNGALWGYILGLLLPFLTSLFVLRNYLGRRHPEKVDWSSFVKFIPFASLALLGLTSLTSADIILVKHFFPAHEAGIYSSLSLVGRVILFASSPVATVMFPLTAERHYSRRRYHHYLFLSLVLVGALSATITFFYSLFPNFSVRFFFGSKFLEAAPFLGFFGLFITFYSLCNVLINFFLSVNKTPVAFFPILAGLFQLILINFFHRNFWQVIAVSTSVTALLAITLLLYLFLDDDFRRRARLQAGSHD